MIQDFDWEAAVREIDVACQSSSTKAQRIPLVKNGSNHQLNKVQNNCRQLKLDEFLSNGVSKSSTVNEVGVRGKDEEIKVQERGCYVDIDPEAAKTWIYPGIFWEVLIEICKFFVLRIYFPNVREISTSRCCEFAI